MTHQIENGTWELDPDHSEVGFSVKHAGISKVRGKFNVVSGNVVVNDNDTIAVTASADASTFDSGNEGRDAHVRSEEFLDVDNHPDLTFKSTKVTLDGEDIEMEGDLTIRGVTRPVSLSGELGGVAVDPFGVKRFGAEVNGTISRKDFGLTWNAALETGGVLVSDKVALNIDLSFVKAEKG